MSAKIEARLSAILQSRSPDHPSSLKSCKIGMLWEWSLTKNHRLFLWLSAMIFTAWLSYVLQLTHNKSQQNSAVLPWQATRWWNSNEAQFPLHLLLFLQSTLDSAFWITRTISFSCMLPSKFLERFHVHAAPRSLHKCPLLVAQYIWWHPKQYGHLQRSSSDDCWRRDRQEQTTEWCTWKTNHDC